MSSFTEEMPEYGTAVSTGRGSVAGQKSIGCASTAPLAKSGFLLLHGFLKTGHSLMPVGGNTVGPVGGQQPRVAGEVGQAAPGHEDV